MLKFYIKSQKSIVVCKVFFQSIWSNGKNRQNADFFSLHNKPVTFDVFLVFCFYLLIPQNYFYGKSDP